MFFICDITFEPFRYRHVQHLKMTVWTSVNLMKDMSVDWRKSDKNDFKNCYFCQSHIMVTNLYLSERFSDSWNWLDSNKAMTRNNLCSIWISLSRLFVAVKNLIFEGSTIHPECQWGKKKSLLLHQETHNSRYVFPQIIHLNLLQFVERTDS